MNMALAELVEQARSEIRNLLDGMNFKISAAACREGLILIDDAGDAYLAQESDGGPEVYPGLTVKVMIRW